MENRNGTNIFKFVWGKFTWATRITIIVWFLGCILSFEKLMEDGIPMGIATAIFGFVVLGVTAQLISIRIRKKRNHGQWDYIPEHLRRPVRTENRVENATDKPFDTMDGHEFEHFCADILGKSGYTQVEVTRGSGDQGIDILANKDGIKYGIQCKCYTADIGNKAVQEAFAGKTFYGCHVAAVLTNRNFTRSAKELAERNGVLLWDRERLERYINSHN